IRSSDSAAPRKPASNSRCCGRNGRWRFHSGTLARWRWAPGQIAEAMGWSIPYTIGVLTYWKVAPFYCQAVLSHGQRITLDGAPAEPVDAEAKELATRQLAKLAARNAAKQAVAAKAKSKRK